MAKTLTTLAVDKLRAEAVRREVPNGGLKGLYLVVQPSGKKSWAVRYRHAGQTRKLTIGPYPAFDLKQAREAASGVLRAASEGAEPVKDKIAAKELAVASLDPEDTVEKQIEVFIQRHASQNRTGGEVERLFRREVIPVWREKRVGDLKRSDVVRLLDEIVDRGAPFSANRVHANLRKFGNWWVSRGLIERSFCERVAPPAATVRRDRILDDRELALVWRAADAISFPFGPIMLLLILTAQRREEVAGMRWSEINLEKAGWTIPRERAKNDKAHVVALSAPAMAILKAVPHIANTEGKNSNFVFTTNGRTSVSGFSRAKQHLDAQIEKLVDETAHAMSAWRIHDLRRTAASGMARLGIGIPVVEKILNHTSGTFAGIVGIYQRHEFVEERRKALEAWASFVMSWVEVKRSNVMPIETTE